MSHSTETITTHNADMLDGRHFQEVIDEAIQQINAETGQSSVMQYDNIYGFPNVGNESILYIAKVAGKLYRWDAVNLYYYIVGTNYDDIKVINGGTASE